MKTNGNDPINCMPSEEFSDRFNEGISLQTGLSKREYFAAMAMQAMLAPWNGRAKKSVEIALEATVPADALIEALNKENK